jgi:hypothetical protein
LVLASSLEARIAEARRQLRGQQRPETRQRQDGAGAALLSPERAAPMPRSSGGASALTGAKVIERGGDFPLADVLLWTAAREKVAELRGAN